MEIELIITIGLGIFIFVYVGYLILWMTNDMEKKIKQQNKDVKEIKDLPWIAELNHKKGKIKWK